MFALNLYPGPSAKKGIYGVLIALGLGWIAAEGGRDAPAAGGATGAGTPPTTAAEPARPPDDTGTATPSPGR